jgi:hypothetical protein
MNQSGFYIAGCGWNINNVNVYGGFLGHVSKYNWYDPESFINCKPIEIKEQSNQLIRISLLINREFLNIKVEFDFFIEFYDLQGTRFFQRIEYRDKFMVWPPEKCK